MWGRCGGGVGEVWGEIPEVTSSLIRGRVPMVTSFNSAAGSNMILMVHQFSLCDIENPLFETSRRPAARRLRSVAGSQRTARASPWGDNSTCACSSSSAGIATGGVRDWRPFLAWCRPRPLRHRKGSRRLLRRSSGYGWNRLQRWGRELIRRSEDLKIYIRG